MIMGMTGGLLVNYSGFAGYVSKIIFNIVRL